VLPLRGPRSCAQFHTNPKLVKKSELAGGTYPQVPQADKILVK
jgi:hypothetical protein